jgi:hypothetical protein
MNHADQSVARAPHVPVADALAALDAADTGPRREVLVLGAGMAGLAAGYELHAGGGARRAAGAVHVPIKCHRTRRSHMRLKVSRPAPVIVSTMKMRAWRPQAHGNAPSPA